MLLVFACSNVACYPPARREKHTESAVNTSHSVSILAQAAGDELDGAEALALSTDSDELDVDDTVYGHGLSG